MQQHDEQLCYPHDSISTYCRAVDNDIQSEVLAKHSQLKTFNQMFDLIQAMEDGKRAKDQLNHETAIRQSSISSQRSSYKHKNRTVTAKQVQKRETCSGCGSSDHAPDTKKLRKDNCLAWNANCDHCGIQGHLAIVYRKKSRVTSHGASLAGSCMSTTDNAPTATHATQQTSSWIYAAHEDAIATKKFVSDLQRENRRAWQYSGHLSSRINIIQNRIIVPHMEWDTAQQGFTPHQPGIPSATEYPQDRTGRLEWLSLTSSFSICS